MVRQTWWNREISLQTTALCFGKLGETEISLQTTALWFDKLGETEKLAYKLRLYDSTNLVKQRNLSLNYGFMIRQTWWNREISLQTTALWFGKLGETEKLANKPRLFDSANLVKQRN